MVICVTCALLQVYCTRQFVHFYSFIATQSPLAAFQQTGESEKTTFHERNASWGLFQSSEMSVIYSIARNVSHAGLKHVHAGDSSFAGKLQEFSYRSKKHEPDR